MLVKIIVIAGWQTRSGHTWHEEENHDQGEDISSCVETEGACRTRSDEQGRESQGDYRRKEEACGNSPRPGRHG